jgi:hypothetical protein
MASLVAYSLRPSLNDPALKLTFIKKNVGPRGQRKPNRMVDNSEFGQIRALDTRLRRVQIKTSWS